METENKVIITFCEVDKMFCISRNNNELHHQKGKPTQTDIIEALMSDNWSSRFEDMRRGKKVRVSDRIYYDMLGSVPPLKAIPDGFVSGEAYSGNTYYHFWREDNFIYGQLKEVTK